MGLRSSRVPQWHSQRLGVEGLQEHITNNIMDGFEFYEIVRE